MPNYRSLGDVPRKRHLREAGPDGGLLFEELMGEEGFSGDSSLLYHRRSPSALVDAKAVIADPVAMVANQPLVPHHLRVPALPVGGDPVTGRQVLLGNDDVVLSWVAADTGGRSTATRWATSWCSCSRGRRCWSRCSDGCRWAPATTW